MKKDNFENLAVIPARGGSKRIPRKNIRFFHGKPMIAWSIEVAKASEMFEHIIVSTDDQEIAEIAIKFGAEVPFLRPEELSDDIAPTVPVIAHSVSSCEQLGWHFDNVCCIYPCAPFIEVNDLIGAYRVLVSSGSDYVYPIAEFSHPIQRAMSRCETGRMEFVNPEFETVRTQDLNDFYHDTGQFYWGKSSSWKSLIKMHSEGNGFVVPSWSSVDIDTEDDWRRAELMFRLRKDERS